GDRAGRGHSGGAGHARSRYPGRAGQLRAAAGANRPGDRHSHGGALPMSSLSPQDFQLLADLLRSRSGFVLGPEKGYLLESRLTPVARRRGLDSLTQLVQLLRQKPDELLVHEISEAMTINESFFFRDDVPFEILAKHVLPAMRTARAGSKRLRIWSAACSTGQE